MNKMSVWFKKSLLLSALLPAASAFANTGNYVFVNQDKKPIYASVSFVTNNGSPVASATVNGSQTVSGSIAIPDSATYTLDAVGGASVTNLTTNCSSSVVVPVTTSTATITAVVTYSRAKGKLVCQVQGSVAQ